MYAVKKERERDIHTHRQRQRDRQRQRRERDRDRETDRDRPVEAGRKKYCVWVSEFLPMVIEVETAKTILFLEV